MHPLTLPAIFTALLLSACAIPTTPDDLRRAYKGEATKACYTLSADEAATRIENGWKRCRGTGLSKPRETWLMVSGVPVMIRNPRYQQFVRSERNADTITVMYGMHESDVMMIADIRGTSRCGAEVTATGWNVFWNQWAADALEFVEDPEAKCKG